MGIFHLVFIVRSTDQYIIRIKLPVKNKINGTTDGLFLVKTTLDKKRN